MADVSDDDYDWVDDYEPEPVLMRCQGRFTRRTVDADGTVHVDRSDQCTTMVDLAKPSGRFCANCLVPTAAVAYKIRASQIHYSDLILEILKRMPLHELVYVRDDIVLQPFADYLLAKAGYDPKYLIYTWNGAVYDLDRLATMMAQARLARRIHSTLAQRASHDESLSIASDPPFPSQGSRIPSAQGAINAAIQEGRIEALEYIVTQNDRYDSEVFGYFHIEAIAKTGNLPMLRWGLDYLAQESSSDFLTNTAKTFAVRGAIAGGHVAVIRAMLMKRWTTDDRTMYELILAAGIKGNMLVMAVLVTALRFLNPTGVSHFNTNICHNLRNYVIPMEWLHSSDDPHDYPCLGTCEYAVRITHADSE